MLIHFRLLLFFFAEMARDSAVGRDRVLVMPSAGGAIPLDGVPNQPQAPDDINQQILEVNTTQSINL